MTIDKKKGTVIIHLRLTSGLRKSIEEMSIEENRSVSNLIRTILEEYFKIRAKRTRINFHYDPISTSKNGTDLPK